MLISTDKLSNKQLNDLEVLSRHCKQIDGNTIPIYPHILAKLRAKPCSLLYYHQQQLIGFLSVFFFYSDSCEVAVLVDPIHRQQGIARQMLTQSLAIFDLQVIHTLLFSTTPAFSFLPQYGFNYRYSELQMKRDSKIAVPEPRQSGLVIRRATHDDITALSVIDLACFPTQAAHMDARFSMLLNDPDYFLFIAHLDNCPIGKAHIQCIPDGAHFADIAVLPDFQGNGFGKSLLAFCINYALHNQKYNLQLDVETDNKNALKLYTGLGFSINNVCDYWATPIKSLYSRYQLA